ncbi:sugar transferase [Alphaproteobacteria bacterium]|nr:sugar transferase [Alphaproteobacteria bacterium]
MIYKIFFKRPLDIFGSLALLCVCLIPLMIISILTYISLGTPIFFQQTRSGKNKKQFEIIKFRTMRDYVDGDNDANRLTPLGSILRKYSLDELPQLINILTGEMSLVGPRPLLPKFDDHYSEEQNKRFLVKPGVTGLAQIRGRNFLSWDDRFKADVEYIDKITFVNDMRILFKTAIVVLGSKNFIQGDLEDKFNDL